MNMYGYVRADPVNFIDPFGLQGQENGCGGVGQPRCPVVNGQPAVGSGVGGSGTGYAMGGVGFSNDASTPAELQEGQFAGSPHSGVCGNEDCSDALVTAPTTKTPFYFNGVAWVSNPHWIKPWWSPWFDRGVGVMFVGPVAVMGGVEGAGLVGLQEYSLTRTVAGHLGSRPYLNSRFLIQEIRAAGRAIRDPGGVPGALRYDVAGSFNGTQGVWELVVHPGTGLIYHFLFRGTP